MTNQSKLSLLSFIFIAVVLAGCENIDGSDGASMKNIEESSKPSVPSQLDIAGLKPGISTNEQVLALHIDKKVGILGGMDMKGFVIGGYLFNVCVPKDYHEDKLSYFFCRTGKINSVDISSENAYFAKNIEVHETLVKGFTKKFGTPSIIEDVPVRTRVGVDYTSNKVVWIDSQGNGLILRSMVDSIEEGKIEIVSSEKLKELEEATKERNDRRNF